MNIKIDILNVLKHGNKHDLIHFVTLSIYLSILHPREYFWQGLRFVLGSVLGKGENKSMTVSLQQADRLKCKSTRVWVIKTDFLDGSTLKIRGGGRWGGSKN